MPMERATVPLPDNHLTRQRKERSEMGERNVAYVLEIVDDIPERSYAPSPLETALENIAKDYEAMPEDSRKPITAIIALYDKPTATTAAANVLRQRHGTQDVEGWRFETRHVKRTVDGQEVDRTALFVNYDPTKIIPGAREQWDEKEKQRLAKLEQKRKEREANKTSTPNADAAKAASADAVPGGQPNQAQAAATTAAVQSSPGQPGNSTAATGPAPTPQTTNAAQVPPQTQNTGQVEQGSKGKEAAKK